MASKPVPPPEERDLGLMFYYTDTDPLGGIIKKEPEDFIVAEISDDPREEAAGPYTIAKIRSRNWETNRLVRAFSKNFGISRKQIKFAGTKDKRAVTTQLFSFRLEPEALDDLSLADVEVLSRYRSNRELELGYLMGNSFHIRIRDMQKKKQEIEEIARDTMNELVSTGGFPNYFGVQRFGVIRPITHLVGKHILHGRLKEAVMTYVGQPMQLEESEIRSARERIEVEMDFQEAVDYYPANFLFERSMIHHLKRKPDDWAGALDQLPDNLKMMFVHAYQSYLFNMILSERIKRSIPLNEPIPGDLVLPLNKKGLPDHYNPVEVNPSNMKAMTGLVNDRKGFVSALIA
ncbi:MAG: tRNA pseudouridine(13) synthase TruD, partial [Thermoplasmatota archaeon]